MGAARPSSRVAPDGPAGSVSPVFPQHFAHRWGCDKVQRHSQRYFYQIQIKAEPVVQRPASVSNAEDQQLNLGNEPELFSLLRVVRCDFPILYLGKDILYRHRMFSVKAAFSAFPLRG